jgi:hypothetical protein
MPLDFWVSPIREDDEEELVALKELERKLLGLDLAVAFIEEGGNN